MRGIVHLHSYIPKYRVHVKEINKAWGNSGGSGERSVANYDEDVLTMGVQSVVDQSFSESIDACVLATTSSPFKEESAAAILSYTLGHNSSIQAVDVNQSESSGLASMSLFNKNESPMLLVASDRRNPKSGSAQEKEIGSAACAVEIGTNNVIAEIVATERENDFGYQTWQKSTDETLYSADERFSSQVRTSKYIDVAKRLLDQANLSSDNLSHLIVADRSPRIQSKVAKSLEEEDLGLTSKLYESVGYTGVSMPFLLLNEVFNKAVSGEYVLCLQSGSGVEAVLFRITDEITTFQEQNKLQKLLDNTEEVDYHEFLRKSNKNERSDLKPFSSLTYMRRERDSNFRLMAQVCDSCSAIHFPKQIICRECKQKLDEPNTLLKHRGRIFTFTHDHVFPGKGDHITMAVIDLEDGGRIYTQMTDSKEADITMGLNVKLVFRKFHEGADYPNYYWKAIPSQIGEN